MSLHPSSALSFTAPLRSRPKRSSSTASLLGRLDCVLVRRRNSSLIRSRAFVVRSAFHCDVPKQRRERASHPPRVRTGKVEAQDRLVHAGRTPLVARDHRAPPFARPIL